MEFAQLLMQRKTKNKTLKKEAQRILQQSPTKGAHLLHKAILNKDTDTKERRLSYFTIY